MDFIVAGIVILIVALALYHTIKQAKAGGCAGCSSKGACSSSSSDCGEDNCPSRKL